MLSFSLRTRCTEIILKFVITYCKNWVIYNVDGRKERTKNITITIIIIIIIIIIIVIMGEFEGCKRSWKALKNKLKLT